MVPRHAEAGHPDHATAQLVLLRLSLQALTECRQLVRWKQWIGYTHLKGLTNRLDARCRLCHEKTSRLTHKVSILSSPIELLTYVWLDG